MFSQTKFKANREEVRKAEEIATQLLGAELNPAPEESRYLDQLRAADLFKDGQPYAEVKCDFKSALTKNVCIEVASLFKSSAPYVVYMLPAYFMAPRVELLATSQNWSLVKGGDFNEGLVLIKKAEFIKLPFVTKIS